MCGFAGFVGDGSEGRAAETLLSAMGAAISHRGPDGDGQLLTPGAGLAHVRLSIVGLADGQQPMTEPSGRFTIVFNGEIFNYVELRRDLEARGVVFRTGSDTEVLLQLYGTFGDDCLSRLNGDSPSPSGTPATGGCCWRATAWACGLSFIQNTAARSISPPR